MTINVKGKLIDLSDPIIMGILNITPDSFYDGGFYNSEKKIIAQVKKMINDGASIIDIGGYSSRPGAEDISVETELSRVLTVIKAIKHKFPETLTCPSWLILNLVAVFSTPFFSKGIVP